MPRSLHKVQKYVSKKRGGKPTSLHENSRDAQRLRRAGAREEKLTKILHAATKSNQNYVNRISWYQSAIAGSNGPLSADEMLVLTTSFISREEEELDALKTQRRPGRPSSSREDQLKRRLDAENREFRSGFWIPDLRDEESRSKLERWSGDWAGMNSLRFVRLAEAGGITESSFPPKGLS